MTDDEIKNNDFHINPAIGLDNKTMPIHGNADPYIVLEYIHDETLFVALFNNHSFTHYHFIYSIKDRKIVSKVGKYILENTAKENFPVKAFYNDRKDEFYVFYKMGQGFTIQKDDVEKF